MQNANDNGVWSFLNSKDQSQKIHAIGLASAKCIVELLSAANKGDWYVKHKDWDRAQRVIDCPDLSPPQGVNLQAFEAECGSITFDMMEMKAAAARGEVKAPMATIPQPLPQPQPTHRVPAPAVAMQAPPPAGATDKNQKYSQKRRHKRVKAKFRVLVFIDEKVFRAHTKDVSLGGLFLENPVPKKFEGSTCRVVIGSMDNRINIELVANLRECLEKGARVVFDAQQTRASLDQLNAWINEAELGAASEQKAA